MNAETGPDRRLYAYFDQIPVAVLVTDAEGRVVYLNHNCRRLFGYSMEQAKSISLNDLIPMRHRDGHAELSRQFCLAPAPRPMGLDRIVLGLRKDGSEVPVEIGLGVLETDSGLRVVATIQDITKRRAVEAELRSAIEELGQRNSDLDEFVYMASHDLQEPLRKLTSFSELLRGDLGEDLPEAAEKDLKFIVESAERMRRLVKDLLSLSRAGKSAIEFQDVDLNECLNEALEMLEDRIRATGASVRAPALPTVRGDATLITQLLLNLIGNGLKFVSRGMTPEIEVTLEAQGERTVIGVKDNGIGIPPEFHDRIFSAFRRLHRREEYDGTGVGLSICRKVVERHKGRLWVDSELGRGAHFRFTLGSA
ncbi:MAG TPA: ATP-binding protein [Phycisphaerae bacterium]|nr:ATP-binding protein [Phycisphaerae bacterium]HRW51464.1 ATP-binding protein [Phycisphaerae bacterium]